MNEHSQLWNTPAKQTKTQKTESYPDLLSVIGNIRDRSMY